MATNDRGDQPRGGGWDMLERVLVRGGGNSTGRRRTRAWRRRLDRGEADSYHERMTAEREMRRMSALWYRLFPIDYDAIPVAEYEPLPDGVPEGVDEGLLVPGIAAEAITAGLGLASKGEEEPQPVAETHSDTSNRNTVMFGNSALSTLLAKGTRGEGHGRPRTDDAALIEDEPRLPGELDELYDEAQGLLAAIPDEEEEKPRPAAEAPDSERPVDATLIEEAREEQAEEAAREWAEIEGEIADAEQRVTSGLDAIDSLSSGARHARRKTEGLSAEVIEEELTADELQALEDEIVAKVAAERSKGEAADAEDASPESEEPPIPDSADDENISTAAADDGEELAAQPVDAGISGRLHSVMGRIRSAVGRGGTTDPDATQPMPAAEGRETAVVVDDDATQPFQGMPGDDSTQPFQGMPDDDSTQLFQGMLDDDATQPFQGMLDDDATQPFQGMLEDDSTQPFSGVPDDDVTQPVPDVASNAMQDEVGHASPTEAGTVPCPEDTPVPRRRATSNRIDLLETHIPTNGEFALPLVGERVNAKVKVMPAQGILLGGHARQARNRGSSSVRLRVRASKVSLRSISLIGPGQGYAPIDSPVGTRCKERTQPRIQPLRRIGEPLGE